MRMSDKTNLLLLLEKPGQPSWFPKNQGKTKLVLPTSYIPEEYKDIGITLNSRFDNDDEEKIQLAEVPVPDLSFTDLIGKNEAFSAFVEKHLKIAGELTSILMKEKDLKSLMSVAAYIKDRVNVYLFQYSFTVALMHRPDTKDCK